MDKQFKTISEQVEILKTRGLDIPDEKMAEDFLYANNYYRVSGYTLTLRKDDKFFSGVTFQNIVDIYEFDADMRNILLKYIEKIEVKFKSVFAHELTRFSGPVGYLNSGVFSNLTKYRQIISRAEQLKIQRLPHEAFLKHFVSELNIAVPFWAYVELLSIADVSILYTISPLEVQIPVARAFNISETQTWLLANFMHHITILRNLCAHDSRIFNRLFEQKPRLSRREKELLRVKENGEVDNEHLFSFILIMRRLLSRETFNDMVTELERLSNDRKFVRMDYYGFPEKWERIGAF